MATKKQSTGINCISNRSRLVRGSFLEVHPPAWIDLTPAEKEVWRSVIKTRLSTDWRDYDMVLVGQLCFIQTQINEQQDSIRLNGATVMSDKGFVPNESLAILSSLIRIQKTLMQSLGLNSMFGDMRAINKKGVVSNLIKGEVVDDGLLAAPDIA